MARSRDIITTSPDLKLLHDDGFELSIKHAHLLVSSVPYLTATRTLARGILIFPLTMSTDMMTGKPPDHTAHFAGDKPHYADGTPIAGIINKEETKELAEGIVSKFYFSSKPVTPDVDYDVKVRRYVDLIETPARALFPKATAQTRRIVESEDDDSPFVFPDTNSARAEITPITDKLKGLKIAIVGLGGTGSYVLDFVAKTPVKEIHLFDDDEFSLHNAYRAPGTPTSYQLRAWKLKVIYLAEIYSRWHKGLIPHAVRVDGTNVANLTGLNFAFLCMDPGPDKATLVDFLVNSSIPFVDTGLGVEATADTLVGMVNTITVTPDYKKHIQNIPLKTGGDDELYASNIQIAELNALNAALAVIRWKKHFGFYLDERKEHESTYTIGPDMITNAEITA
jgi:hypothetical protein